MSVYLVPLLLGHEGANATSSKAGSAVAFIAACKGVPFAEVIEEFTVRVSLRLSWVPAVVSSKEVASVEALVAVSAIDFDVDSEDESLEAVDLELSSSGQTTFGSQAFFEQHPLNPVDRQA